MGEYPGEGEIQIIKSESERPPLGKYWYIESPDTKSLRLYRANADTL